MTNQLARDPWMDRHFRHACRAENEGRRKPRFSPTEVEKARDGFFGMLKGEVPMKHRWIFLLVVVALALVGCHRAPPVVAQPALDDPAQYEDGPAQAPAPATTGPPLPRAAAKPEPDVESQPTPDRANLALLEMLHGIEVGDGTSRKGITVFPLRQRNWRNTSSAAHVDSSFAYQNARFRETGLPHRIAVDNRGRRPLLLVAGQILTGGERDRIVATDALVPPGATDFVVPTFVAQRRGYASGSRRALQSARALAPGPVRYDILARSRRTLADRQATVGYDIERLLSHYNAGSRAARLVDIYRRGHLPALLSCFHRRGLPRFPADTVGLLVMHGDRVLGAEVFPSRAAFNDGRRAALDAILAGRQALEGVCSGSGGHVTTHATARRAWQALRHARRYAAPQPLRDLPGAGHTIYLRADGLAARGIALTHEGEVVHLSIVGSPGALTVRDRPHPRPVRPVDIRRRHPGPKPPGPAVPPTGIRRAGAHRFDAEANDTDRRPRKRRLVTVAKPAYQDADERDDDQ